MRVVTGAIALHCYHTNHSFLVVQAMDIAYATAPINESLVRHFSAKSTVLSIDMISALPSRNPLRNLT